MATNLNFEANNNSIEGKSNAILRTNPLLSSNVKLVVDSKGEIYLDSINANRALSDQRYKKFNLDANGHYAYDLASFYANTPNNTIYDVYRTDSDLSVYREYNKQYEEQYNYGARLNGSKGFDENIRFMAPLWINEKLPEYFVIYRIEEPVSGNVLLDSVDDSDPIVPTRDGINSHIMNMLSNATIVKTFDLRKSTGSKIGTYLDTFVNDPKRPKAPLTISFEKDEKSSWNGIDLYKGGFSSKGEYIYRDFVLQDRVEMLNNEFITHGFKRNQLVSANLINLEFLFEDFDNAYEVNRYIGVYVNAHEEGEFKHIKYTNNVLQINSDTVKTNFDLTNTSLTDLDMLPKTELYDPTLHWVKSGKSFAHIKNLIDSDQSALKLNVNAFNIDTSKFVKREDTLTITSYLDNAKDFIEIEVIDTPNPADEYILGLKTEMQEDFLDLSRFTIIAESQTLDAGESEAHKFSTKGSTRDIAKAMRGAMLNILDLHLDVTVNNNKILITNTSSGNRRYNMAFSVNNTNNDCLSIVGLSDNETRKIGFDQAFYDDYNVYVGLGGSFDGQGFLISEDEVGDIDENTYLKTKNGFIKVVETIKDPVQTKYYRVCISGPIDRREIKDVNLQLWTENTIKFGKFEAFDFHDFDFNFYSTANSELGELQYEIDYNISGVDANQVDLLQDTYANLQGVKNSVTKNSSGVISIANEYDRLQENYNTELALASRIIPTINKWRYLDGHNAKEMPYMLSMSEAFGKTNLSPDIDVRGRSIADMTHEWYYLYKHPYYDSLTSSRDVANMVTSLKSYIQPEIDINLDLSKLTDVNNNYFDRLFVYEGYDVAGAGFAPAGPSAKYVRLRGGSTQAPSEALFRGLKVKLYERKEFNETNPKNLITSTSFNDYKFTAVLNFNANQSKNGVEIKVVQNKAFKFVCLYIELNSTETGFESINRELLYSLRDVFSNGSIDDTEINGYLNFDIAQDADGKYADAVGVNTTLIRDIPINQNGGYNKIKFSYAGLDWYAPVISVTSNNAIRIATDNYKIQELGGSNTLNITSLSTSDWENITFEYQDGGYGLFKSLTEYVSTKNIVDILNNNDTTSIEYLTVEEDGTINPNRFILNVEDGHKLTKMSTLKPIADPNKPQSYKVSAGKVGYIVVERDDAYQATLIRMSGYYTPLTRPVVTFTDLYQYFKTTQLEDQGTLTLEEEREKLLYNTYNRLGIAFGSYVNRGQYKYGLIEDLFYHKVNPEKADGILKLSNTTGSQPKYPLIDEVAIEKRDINVFRSSWEDEFYVKNGSKQSNKNVYGTLSTHEESAFLASTLNLPKSKYEITTYDAIEKVNTLDTLKSIDQANNFTKDIAQFEDAERIYLDMYVDNLLVNLLEDDNAGLSIKKFVEVSQSYGDKTSLRDDIRKYIEVNLLKLMNIEEIKVYAKDDKTIASSTVVSAENLNDILDSGFTESKNFRIEYDTINPLKLRVIYNKRAGFRHKLYIYIKIRS